MRSRSALAQLRAPREPPEQEARRFVRERLQAEVDCAVRVLREHAHAKAPAFGARVDAHGRKEQQRRDVDELEEVLGELPRRAVRPVHVLDREHDRTAAGQARDPGPVGPPDLRCELVRRERAKALLLGRFGLERQQARQVRQDVRPLGLREQPELGVELGADREVGLALLGAEPGAQDLDEGPVEEIGAVREAVALEHGSAVDGERAELVDEAGLADAGLAEQEDDLAPAGGELVQARAQPGHLLLAAASGVDGAARTAACASTSRHASTGSCRPFTVICPSGSRTNLWTSDRAVAGPTSIEFGSAAAWRRAATFAVSPSETD